MLRTLAPLLPWSSLLVAAVAWSVLAVLVVGRLVGTGGKGQAGGAAGEPGRAARRGRAGVLVAAAAVAIAATAVFRSSLRPAELDVRSLTIATRSHVTDRSALTDAGGVVPLELLEDTVAEGEVPGGFEGQVIVADGASARSNCHGWVFTGGRYCIPGESVDAILRDNGYANVTDARAGDLVIYRDDAGDPIHTGVVKAVGEGGFVLVESKWGQLDVFWHTAVNGAYGSRFDYWRSARAGHLLRLSTAAPPDRRPNGTGDGPVSAPARRS